MRTSSLSLALAALLVASTAAAQQPPSPAAVSEARDRFQRGVALFEEHNYNAAMTEFQRAYELTRNPLVLFNISATHELSGHYVEALDTMLDYERLAPRETVAQRRAEINASLARLRQRVGSVVVRFEAQGAEVRIDGLQRSMSEARTGLRVPAGRHRITLSAPHYQSREEEVDIAGGTTVVISEPLTPERAFMAVECNVPSAEVLIDGRPVATTPVTSPLPVPEGSHHVMIRRAGYTPYETDVNSVGAGARVRAQLAWSDPMPRDVGARVIINASEAHAVAYLDGRRISLEGTDLVPPGRHTLRVERTDFLPDEQDVDLSAGRDNPITVRLQPTPAYREQYMASRRRSLITGGVVLGAGLAIAGGGFAWFYLNEGDLSTRTERYNYLVVQVNNEAARMGSGDLTGCTTAPGRTSLETLQVCRNNASVDVDNATILRYVSVGVMGAGAVVAVIGGVLMATSPSGDRFERHARGTGVRLLGGPQHVGFELTF